MMLQPTEPYQPGLWSLDVDLFVVSLVTPMPVDLKPEVEVLSIFGGPRVLHGLS